MSTCTHAEEKDKKKEERSRITKYEAEKSKNVYD
jgi:hypothetical protein